MSQRIPRSLQRITRLDFLDGLGISVTAAAAAFVHLRKRLTNITLLAHRVVSLPEAGDERRRALAAAAAEFVRDSDAPIDRAYVSLPRGTALWARLGVPVAAQGDLEQVVDFEIDRLLPLSRDEVFFDHLVRENQEKLDLQIVALPREAVSEILVALELAEIHPRSLVVTPVALADALSFAQVTEEAPLALVLRDGVRAEIDVFQDDRLCASHVYEARELSTPEAVQARGIAEAGAAGIAREALRVVDVSLDDASADVASEDASGAAELLGAVIEPLVVRDVASVGLKPALLPALGVGLAAVREGSVSLDLLPPEERRGGEEGAPVVTFFLAALLALVTSTWLLSALVQDFRIRSHLTSELAAIEPGLREIRAQEAETRDLAEKIRLISRGEQGLATLYLRELTEVVPPNAYINTFRMRNGKIELEGFAKEASDLIPAIEKSRYFADPQFTSPVTKVKDNEERFSLATRVSE